MTLERMLAHWHACLIAAYRHAGKANNPSGGMTPQTFDSASLTLQVA